MTLCCNPRGYTVTISFDLIRSVDKMEGSAASTAARVLNGIRSFQRKKVRSVGRLTPQVPNAVKSCTVTYIEADRSKNISIPQPRTGFVR
jgi:hypothetical protein